ncbi:MAG: hypothetical protein IKF68_02570 [Erysipelotrichaceae bacterium]|nr:hypothetical protein [Erysipelotrichaceae bacterium]
MDDGRSYGRLRRYISSYLEEYIDDEEKRRELAEDLSEYCLEGYEDLYELYEGDQEEMQDDLDELIESSIEYLGRKEETPETDNGPGLFTSLVGLVFGTAEDAKGSAFSKEERFRSEHGNEEDFFEMYRDDFDDDEEAQDAFYEEIEDEET